MSTWTTVFWVPEDSLVDRGVSNVLDERVARRREHPFAVFDRGRTAREGAGHWKLGKRPAREVPDIVPVIDQGDGLGGASDTDGELYHQVGVVRGVR